MKHPGSIVKVSLDDMRAIILEDIPNCRIRVGVGHHSWKPTAAQCLRGNVGQIMRGIRRHHVKVRGWRDVGYNGPLLAPDGSIYTGRSLRRGGAHCIGHNRDGIGIMLAMNGDRELLADYPEMEHNFLELAAEYCRVHGLDQHDWYGHRDFSRKSCPGNLFDLEHYRDLLAQLVNPVGSELLWVRLVVDGTHIEGLPLVNRDGHVQFAEQVESVMGDPPGGAIKGEWVRNWLEARGYVIHSWRPREGPAGSVYAYKRE